MRLLLALAPILAATTGLAQGTINFGNQNIPNDSGFGTYNAPIFGSISTVGAGPTYTAGLFLASNLTTPLTTTGFQTDLGMNSTPEYFQIFSQQVTVPGVDAGQQASLAVRVWYGSPEEYDPNSNGFTTRPSPAREALDVRFTSRQLGGTPVGGGSAFPTPGMTGFGGTTFGGSVVTGSLRPDGGFDMALRAVPEPSLQLLGLFGVALFCSATEKLSLAGLRRAAFRT